MDGTESDAGWRQSPAGLRGGVSWPAAGSRWHCRLASAAGSAGDRVNVTPSVGGTEPQAVLDAGL